MNQRANHRCVMCGTDRSEVVGGMHIVGVHGAVCLPCVATCNCIVAAPNGAPTEGARFPIEAQGHCVLCNGPNNGAEYSGGYLKGMHGDLCKDCLHLCNEIQKQEYNKT
jgi:hypothetical protein